MNQIEPIKKLPDLDWSEQAKKEIEMTGEELVDRSDVVFRIGNIASIGFIYSSFLTPPWMWFVLAKGASIGDLLDMRRLAVRIPKGTLTCVDEEFKAGKKFARLYGFEYIGEDIDCNGKRYNLMEKE